MFVMVRQTPSLNFLHIIILLTPMLNFTLTLDLVYTAITRARKWFTVVDAKRGVLKEAVVREVARVSGVGG